MYDELIKQLRELAEKQFFDFERKPYLQAADAIEEQSKPKWISVTEQLPDYPGRFMCYYEIDDCGEVGHCIDWGKYDPDDGWYVSGVTHWMSLPEPPKEET